MVKGITKQVIVVSSPHEDIFDQAIFILKDKLSIILSFLALMLVNKDVLQMLYNQDLILLQFYHPDQ